MKGKFQIKGLGNCLVGTYALRNLTKHFSCEAQQLLFLATEKGMSLEFTSYFLKYTYENALIQKDGAGFQQMSIEEIDLFLDRTTPTEEEYKDAINALWISIVGMTAEEFAQKNKLKSSNKDESETKKKIGTSTGKKLTKLD